MKHLFSKLKLGGVLVLACVVALAGPTDLILNGPFGWHVHQLAAWQGGLELLAIGVLSFLIAYLAAGLVLRGILLALVVELYARRHGFDLDLALSLLYFEAICCLGMLVTRRIVSSPLDRSDETILAIFVGILLWSVVLWAASALGFGSLASLQIIALCVLLACLALYGALPLTAYLFAKSTHKSAFSSAYLAFFIISIMMLFAKARVSFDYDSLWYGLRPQYVLLAGGSVFKSLGLVAPVHYYPKAYELLLAPLAGLDSATVMFGFSIWMWVATGAVIYGIGRTLKWDERIRKLCVMGVLSIPAIMNVAITAKGDIAAACVTLVALYTLLKYVGSGDFGFALLSIAAVFFAPLFRLSVIPYVGMLFILAVSAAITREWGRVRYAQGFAGSEESMRRLGYFIFLASLLVFFLVELRTLLVAGVPIISPRAAVQLMGKLGLSVSYPVGVPMSWANVVTPGVLTLLFDYVFRPSRLPHVLIYWSGSLWLFLLMTAAFIRDRPALHLRPLAPLIILGLSWPAILGFKKFGVVGGDGNYFIVPIIALTIVGFHSARSLLLRGGVAGAPYRISLGLFISVGIAVSLVTGSWGPGTIPWDTNFTRTPFDYPVRANTAIEYHRLGDIRDALTGLPPATRVVGLVPDPIGSWLPVRYESLRVIAWSRPSILASEKSILKFFRKEKISYVILPVTPSSDSEKALWTKVDQALERLHQRGNSVVARRTERFTLWRLN